MEGSGSVRLINLIKKHGYNKDLSVSLATVTSGFPEFKIQIDGMKIELDKDDVIIAEHLTKHKRIMTIRKRTDPRFASGYSREFNSLISVKSTNVNESMSVEGYVSHTHDISSLELNDIQNSFTFEDVEIEYQDELKKGDRVIVVSDNDQEYYVIDRAVML